MPAGMSYSSAVQKKIYLSWKPVFSQPRYSQLRKLSKIKAVINLHAPASHKFWHPNLAIILKDLLEKDVFYLEPRARDIFPELFSSAQLEKGLEMASGTKWTNFGSAAQLSLTGDDEPSKELMESLEGYLLLCLLTALPLNATKLTNPWARLYTSCNYSDLVISCQGKSYRVHRAIICPRFSFFEAACSGQFKASCYLQTKVLKKTNVFLLSRHSREGSSSQMMIPMLSMR